MKVRLETILLVIFVMLLCSCDKNNITSEENNDELFLEEKSTDNSEDNEDKLFSDNSEELYPPKFKDMSQGNMTLLYKYDGYWSMRFGEYFRLETLKVSHTKVNDNSI
jgi:hypothetical protein